MRVLILAASAVWAFLGQASAQVNGPVLGLVPDGSAVRSMYGLPAAGSVGAVISGGQALTNIAISPAQNFAIATGGDGSTVMVTAAGGVAPVAGASANAGAMVVSPQGSAAALWVPTNSHIEVLTGLPSAPAVNEIDVTAFGAPIVFAVSDGGVVAGSWTDGLRVIGTDGSMTPVGIGERVLAIAFYSGRADFCVATATRVISVVGGSATVLYDATAPSAHGIANAVGTAGIGISTDGRWVVTARSSGEVLVIDSTSGANSTVECGCVPAGVFGIGTSVFRLTGTQPMVKLIDVSSGSVLVVPMAGGSQ
jgi:hypothetical protein